MNENDVLDEINDAVNNDSVHDSVMEAISNYCNDHDLDPDGFVYKITIDIAED